jgi:hypothetical protein
MCPDNKSDLPLKGTSFGVENHMAWYLLVFNRELVIISELKGHHIILHLLGNGVPPKYGPRATVN